MMPDQTREWDLRKLLLIVGIAIALAAGAASTPPVAHAAGKVASDDPDKWISLGLGVKTSFVAQQHGSANGGSYSNRAGIDFQRFYINGSVHKYLKFEVNTECFNCPGSINGVGGGGNTTQGRTPGGTAAGSNFFGGNSTIGLLDAIGKFEFTPQVNLWVGRLLMTGERGELNGPFYMAVYDGFKTPFNSADFSGNFGKGGAGLYSRDNGAVFWGEVNPGGKQLQYSLGVYTGLQSSGGTNCAGGPCGPNQQGSLMYAGRLTFNFLNPERNPGYYTSGTYYGKAGDILALAIGANHQKDGAGSFRASSDFTAFISDLLFEKVLPNDGGVVTVNAEYKQYFANYNKAVAFGGAGASANGCFCQFDGHSYTGYAMYLFPQTVGIGKFQPYGRYTWIQPIDSTNRRETEAGVNYIIDGHNARLSAFWQYGDLASKTLFNWAPGVTGNMVHTFKLALQFQY